MDSNKIVFTIEKSNRDGLGSELNPTEMSELLAFVSSDWSKSLSNMFIMLGHDRYKKFIETVIQTYVNLT